MFSNSAKTAFPYRLLLLGTTAIFFVVVPSARSQELRIAAASDLQFAIKDLAAQYQAQTKQKVEVSYGSSGNFFAQIQNGAPFDLFFSADASYPQKLVSSDAAVADSLYPYAVGRIVLWASPADHLDLAKRGFAVLADVRVQKIAVANPEHAPYGRAAIAALKKSGVYDRIQAKLVFGENISQAAQFVQSGSAQVGVLALSLTTTPALKEGDMWIIPEDLHEPLAQAAVILKYSRNQKAARTFLDFVKSNAGQSILNRYGFRAPQPASPAEHP